MNMANGYHGTGSTEPSHLEHSHVRRQRSMRFSLYPTTPNPQQTRPRTASSRSANTNPSASGPTTPTSPGFPQMPPMPRPARSETLPAHSSYHQRPYTSHNQAPTSDGRSFTTPPIVQHVAQYPPSHSLHRKPSEASRLRALNNGYYRSQSQEGRNTPDRRYANGPPGPPGPPERQYSNGLDRTIQSSASTTPDRPGPARRAPEPGMPDNFSRPRGASLRRRNESPQPLQSVRTFPLQASKEEKTPTDLASSRDRVDSAASATSSNPNPQPTYTLRPSASIPDYQAAPDIYTRQRNLYNSNYRPRGPNGLPQETSNPAFRREPIQRPTDFDGEEMRASFRSALTTNSSFLGTNGTERSSVMTKSSSATSIFGRDDQGMSVDDAIGMYDGGWTDSGMEDNYGPARASASSRPTTASSEQKRMSELEEAMCEKLIEASNDDSLMVPQPILIRDSTQIFSMGDGDTPVQGSSRGVKSRTALDVHENYFGKPQSPLVPSPTARDKPARFWMTEKFDETRDRYGFRKNTQHVPLAQFEAWNGPYTEHLERRRKKWVALMKDNGLESFKPQRFPPKSVKIKRFVRKGIPPDWRGAAWFWYAGGTELLGAHPGLYDELLAKAAAGEVAEADDEIIERDLNRTFPDNIKFKPDPRPVPEGQARDSSIPEPETPTLQSLRRVLQAFSIYNPKIGYCQSLNFLAGLLLLFMEEEKSFWMLNIITRVYLPGTHELNLEGANVDLGVLMMAIKDMMPQVWAKIGGELDGSSVPHSALRLPPITLCTTAWFMSCFIGTLPIESTLRVWDSFFYEGSKTLFRIALTVFKLGEQEIKAVNDPMEIFQVVQTIPRKLVDCNRLMEACFKRRNGFGHLSQETIEKGRVERRRGYAEEREREKNGGQLPRRNASKKGVFGRKKTGLSN